MPFTFDSLMSHRIPEVRQRLTRRDSVLYALSVGFGQDPLDGSQLDFVDSHRPLKAVPTMSVVLAHPGFWMADPATGIDALRVVHGEQRIAMDRPLPVEGEVIGTTRITGLVDKGEGRGALLYSEKEVRDAGSGILLATTRRPASSSILVTAPVRLRRVASGLMIEKVRVTAMGSSIG